MVFCRQVATGEFVNFVNKRCVCYLTMQFKPVSAKFFHFNFLLPFATCGWRVKTGHGFNVQNTNRSFRYALL